MKMFIEDWKEINFTNISSGRFKIISKAIGYGNEKEGERETKKIKSTLFWNKFFQNIFCFMVALSFCVNIWFILTKGV